MSNDAPEYTNAAEKLLNDSVQLAKARNHGMLSGIHVAVAAFSDPNGIATRVAQKLGANASAIHRQLADKLSTFPTQTPAPPQPAPTPDMRNLMNSCEQKRIQLGDALIAVDHFLLCLPSSSPDVEKILTAHQLSAKQIERVLLEMRGSKKVTSKFQDANYESLTKYATDLTERAEQGKLDPCIGRDSELRSIITILARRTKGNPVLVGDAGTGKSQLIDGLAQRITNGDVPEQMRGARVFSLDMAALVAGAQYRGQFEERLKSVIQEVEEATAKAAADNGRIGIILFIDEVHLLMGAGKTDGAMDAANILKPALARGDLKCIGATTPDEFRQHIEKDQALTRRFSVVYVNEPSVADTVSILRGLKEKYEAHHRVQISDAALVSAATMAKRYVPSRHLPDSAIDLVDSSCANLRVQIDSKPEQIDKLERAKLQLQIEAHSLERDKKEKKSADRLKVVQGQLANIEEELRPLLQRYEAERQTVGQLSELQSRLEEKRVKLDRAKRQGDMEKAADLQGFVIPELEAAIVDAKAKALAAEKDQMLRAVVTEEDIAVIVSKITGIPVSKLSMSDRQRLLHLSDKLAERVKGQTEAVTKVADAIVRSRAGLGREGRPIGSFLLAGSSGVGKTELAKTLALEMFNDEKSLVRIDMSEFMEHHAVHRLIGAPPGYVGYEEGGQLTEAVRRRPYQVVLFDEVEKAHPSVLNILLQVLDDGRLTDGHARVVDFSSCVILLTTNLGSELMLSAADAPWAQVQQQVMGKIRSTLRPELLNRFDEIVVFRTLGKETLRSIVLVAFNDINQRLKDRNITISATDAVLDYVLAHSYEADGLGARPVKRFVERMVVTEVSRMIIGGKLSDGSDVQAEMSRDGQKIVYTVRRGRNASGTSQSPPSPTAPM